MKIKTVFALSALMASSMLVACGDDSSSSASDTTSKCEVTDGIVVVSPSAGESFKLGDSVTIVFGSDIAKGGFMFEYRVDASKRGVSLFETSEGPEDPDGKTCYEVTAVLEDVEPSETAVIRVIPYSDQSKGVNSDAFVVTE